ncbi:MAG: hypothetical protein ABIH34_02570 [Nanoarchaeota archaeon]
MGRWMMYSVIFLVVFGCSPALESEDQRAAIYRMTRIGPDKTGNLPWDEETLKYLEHERYVA